MGFLPSVATGFGVAVPEAGRIISAYALGVVVGAPSSRCSARSFRAAKLLLALMGLFAAGNHRQRAGADVRRAWRSRFAAGLPHGAYFGVASLVAAGMAGPGGRARAVGQVMLGLTIATLFGTPVATWAGQMLGWRTAFAFVGTLGVVTSLLVTLYRSERRAGRAAPARCASSARCRSRRSG